MLTTKIWRGTTNAKENEGKIKGVRARANAMEIKEGHQAQRKYKERRNS